MSKHLGDFDASTVIYGKFSTFRPSTGAAFTLGGTPALSVYKDNSTTQSTTGVTLTVDFDSVTGFHHFAIDTSADGAFYAAGSFFDIVITTGTVDSVSVVGTVIASFTIRKNSALKPTTAGRTLDVSAGGEAGIDWANVGTPGSTVSLSATTVATVTTTTTATNLTNAPTAGDLTATMKASVNAEVLDVLATDTFAEAGAVPAATSTLKDKINWMFALSRNKITQTATTQLVRNDADSATIGTSTVSDDGTTAIRGEFT